MSNKFIFDKTITGDLKGESSWKSPSNIALVKYWGKKDLQIPKNPSLSFTLSNCFTICKIKFSTSNVSNKTEFELYFEGKKEISFEKKMKVFFERIKVYCPYLSNLKIIVETNNSFPHSSGIASSASAYSALSLCIMDVEKTIDPSLSSDYFFKKASFLARLGSGSACRSTFGPLVIWGKSNSFNNSSDLFGTKYENKIHDNFKNYHDTILLVDKGKKHMSSTLGHSLMNHHSFSKDRLIQVEKNINSLNNALCNGDFDEFIKITELEALTLHAMMMTSDPYYLLIKPNTLNIINEIWNFRQSTSSKVCFTLDAGANIHLLYPKNEFRQIQSLIENNLIQYCQNNEFINDQVGNGPNKL